jgi:hypothetical protein
MAEIFSTPDIAEIRCETVWRCLTWGCGLTITLRRSACLTFGPRQCPNCDDSQWVREEHRDLIPDSPSLQTENDIAWKAARYDQLITDNGERLWQTERENQVLRGENTELLAFLQNMADVVGTHALEGMLRRIPEVLVHHRKYEGPR